MQRSHSHPVDPAHPVLLLRNDMSVWYNQADSPGQVLGYYLRRAKQ